MSAILRAVGIGMGIMLAGTIPRNILFAANLRYLARLPWAVPVMAIYLWYFWRYLSGDGPPDSTRDLRRRSLRANPVSGRVWVRALFAGSLGVVALVLALRLVNRIVVLPQQQLPDLSKVPALTMWSLLLAAAPVAAFIEEAAFRGYMQEPIERRHGLAVAILITGTMFAVAHLDFTLTLWPYYVAVAGIYGIVTYLAGSIWPAIVLHAGGNIYSNLDLLRHGQAEWQASSGAAELVWVTGVDPAFERLAVAFLIVTTAAAWSFVQLARIAPKAPDRRGAESAV